MRLRYIVRGLLRAPAFTLASIGTIALAVCLSTTVFAVVDGVLFKPLPFPKAGELFEVGGRPGAGSWGDSFSPADLRLLEAANPDIPLAIYGGWWTLTHPERPDMGLRATRVSERFFDVLRLRPLVGGFARSDFARPLRAPGPIPALVSYAFWRDHLGGRADAVGKPLDLDDIRIRVAGILPPDFVFPHYRYSRIDLLFPMPDEWSVSDDRWERNWPAIVRVDPAALVEIGARYDAALKAKVGEYGPVPQEMDGEQPYDRAELTPLGEILGANERPFFSVAFAGAALVVLIACVNVASLFLARTRDRARELRVRTMLGAASRHLAAIVVGEVMAVALIGAVVGIALASPLLALAQHQIPSTLMLLKPARLDWRVLSFAVAVPSTVMLLLSALPLAGALRTAPLAPSATASTPRARSWAASALLAFESGLGIAVVMIGVLVLASFVHLRREPIGMDHRSLAVVNVSNLEYRDTVEDRKAFQDRVAARIEAVPGVGGVAVFGAPLLQRMYSALYVEMPGRQQEGFISNVPVSSRFFEIAGLRVLFGALPAREEIERGDPIAVVSLSAARLLWDDNGAVGRTFEASGQTFTVAAIVDDVRVGSQSEGTVGEVFTPISLSERYYSSYLFRADASALAGVTADVAAAIVRDIPSARVSRSEPLETAIAGTVRLQRFQASLFGVAAGAALLLLAVGVAGIVATSVRRRWREAGIRSALGASGGRIVRMLIADHIRPAVVGITAGLLASWWAKEMLRRLLYELEPGDLRLWTASSAVLMLVVVIAAWLPARRAAHADPALVLRAE